MSTFTPIQTGMPIRQDRCDMTSLNWINATITAQFQSVDDPTHAVRVIFEGVRLARISDEFEYSTAMQPKRIGIEASGFAYLTEGDPLWKSFAETSRFVFKDLAQYTVISLNTCLDVISTQPPQFEWVSRWGAQSA